MDSSIIKYKTIQRINGTKHISDKGIEELCFIVCHDLGIEKCEENFIHIRDACKIYYNLKPIIQ